MRLALMTDPRLDLGLLDYNDDKDVAMVGRTGLHVKSLIVTEKYHVGGSKVRSDRGFWIESNFQLSHCYKNFLANF